MKNFYFLNLFLTSVCLLFFAPANTSALNYTITFTGSGASSTVESVIVQNLTKGTTVTVPTGNVLNLSDVATYVEKVSDNVVGISISPNPIQENATVSFYAKQAGLTQISAFGLDGRKIVSVNANLLQGKNSFTLSIPKGVYLLQVNGNGYSYNAKAISENTSNIKPLISTNSVQPSNKIQKSKSAVTNMLYSSGDQLSYKGYSVGYTSVISDTPISSKNINFVFSTAMDIEGNVYNTVTIGSQVWMLENLKTTKYKDGTSIQLSTTSALKALSTASFCWYNDDITTYKNTYGALYNSFSVATGLLAPTGWHVPNNAEWTVLSNFLGGASVAGGKLKSTGTTFWISPNSNASNSSGFSALPAGGVNNYGNDIVGYNANWWSSDSSTSFPWYWSVTNNSSILYNGDSSKQTAYSVRCIKD